MAYRAMLAKVRIEKAQDLLRKSVEVGQWEMVKVYARIIAAQAEIIESERRAAS